MYKDEEHIKHKKRDRDGDLEEKDTTTENKKSISQSKLFFLVSCFKVMYNKSLLLVGLCVAYMTLLKILSIDDYTKILLCDIDVFFQFLTLFTIYIR